MSERKAEAVIIGAGVMGTSIGLHLAEQGVDTLILDREGPAAGSTARSGALVRTHYATALEAELAWDSLTRYFERWGERIGGGCGFTRTGFAFLSGEEDVGALEHNIDMLQDLGIETSMVDLDELNELDPALSPEGVVRAAYEPRSGYADPSATTVSLLQAAKRNGARFERAQARGLIERGGDIRGVSTDAGDIEAEVVILATGPWSVPLAATVGVELPISPARVQIAFFQRPYSLPTHLTLLDAASRTYSRPTADRLTLVGSRTAGREWLSDPDVYSDEPDEGFVRESALRLAERIPAMVGAAYRGGRAGVNDMTPDGRPIVGPEGPKGLYLCTGWSGAGFKKAPSIGDELAHWIVSGKPKRSELERYSLSRFEKGSLIYGEREYSSTGPH